VIDVPVISAVYFGPVELYRLLARHPEAIVDVGEHYERQSYRTRTSIVGPNGVQDLVVQISRRSGEKMPMSTVGLSYAESWPQQHIHAFRSAYGKTPWAIHFLDDIEELITTEHGRLIDLDLQTMQLCMKWLGLKSVLQVIDHYIEPSEIATGLDLRNSLHPKKPLPSSVEPFPPYPQVFADRHGFVSRLSVIDLLCNTGPHARRYLTV
jgi:hypothetical protein